MLDAASAYGLVLLDDSMPSMTALELAEAIRRDRRTVRADRPAHLVEGRATVGRDIEADGFVTKPVQPRRLHDGDGARSGFRSGSRKPDDETPAESSTGGPSARGDLVLLAEDNEINRSWPCDMLEKHGFQVDVAVNGRVALEMCRHRRYKAVFMDCHMPELDGYETSLEIRRRERPGHHMPIIAMTANTMDGDRELCLAAGMDDHLGKPVDAALLDTIARSLKVIAPVA